VTNKDIAKRLVGTAGSGKGDEKATETKDGGTSTDNASPDGLSAAMEDIGKHLANKDWEGAAQAFRNAHQIAGQDNDDSSEY
jgi:hypothetical protein